MSKEDQILDECKGRRNRFYTYAIPLFNIRNRGEITEDNANFYILNTEVQDFNCRKEAKKNRLYLRND